MLALKNRPTICIYTAIYGDYDDLKEQPRQTLDCDFLCFTDNSSVQARGWEVAYRPGAPEMHPRMQAKYYKLMNHKIFAPPRRWWPFNGGTGRRRYDFTIWIDGSVRLKSESFVEEMIGFLGKYGMAMFVHPERDCIYAEAQVCLHPDFLKYRGLPIREQVESYKFEGYPEHNGLMAAGLILRDMRRRELHQINEDWWQENLRWTYQDQLSLPYVLWKNSYGYDPINLNLWGNHLFDLTAHHSDS